MIDLKIMFHKAMIAFYDLKLQYLLEKRLDIQLQIQQTEREMRRRGIL